jgi:hypothetical protein
MKKNILFIALSFLSLIQISAQEYEYVPLVREGVKWVYYYDNTFSQYPDLAIAKVYLTLEMKGDTVIDGKSYKAMHKYYGDAINIENDTVPIFLREEDKIVYGIVPDGKTFRDCPISCYGNETVYSQINNGEEFILYDFKDPVAFCYYGLDMNMEDDSFKPFKFADMVTISDYLAMRHVFSYAGDYCFIESIGFDGLTDGYLLAYKYPRFMNAPVFCLSHVIEDGKVIYQSAKNINNDPNNAYLSIARSGVKWVFEHVTINNGDTTSYYYTYEFEPIENNQFDYNCYYSSEEEANLITDSIVSLARDMGFEFSCIQNKMLAPFMENGDNLIDFECTNSMSKIYDLYNFDPADISSYCLLNYYIDRQKEDFLNRENFIEIEPLMIEGASCNRYAYVGDDGEVKAYIVEGIGFDSRDMGDLLTPFTRKPDPDADYQEYCGLCHVVKDGKIIYKGMRYNPDNMTGIDEVVVDRRGRYLDPYYYNMMGVPVGKELPTTPGIYIHQGKKICVRY